MAKLGYSEKFKEEIAVNTKRIYDSCATKDYIENLRCYFTDSGQSIVEQSSGVKIKRASVLDVLINIEPIIFRKGYFSIEENFYFDVNLDAIHTNSNVNLNSLCIFKKSINLFGGENDIKYFSSQGKKIDNLPNVVVQISSPIVLDSSLNNVTFAEDIGKIPMVPSEIISHFGSNLSYTNVSKVVNVTIGLFAITHLERNVQVLISSYDCVKPSRECCNEINSKEEFRKMHFPIDDFFHSTKI